MTAPAPGGAPAPAAGPLLSLRGVNKSFGAVQVLRDVDFHAYAREGDGAGRRQRRRQVHPGQGRSPASTGSTPASSSSRGNRSRSTSPKHANDLGIEVVYQDLALCDNLDIVQNMFLGRERRRLGILDEATMEEQATRDPGRALGADRQVGAPAGVQPLRRPAPDRRDRQGRAVEHQARHPRRADRRARRRPDRAGAASWCAGWPTTASPSS